VKLGYEQAERGGENSAEIAAAMAPIAYCCRESAVKRGKSGLNARDRSGRFKFL
jgi:hypothetical protein